MLLRLATRKLKPTVIILLTVGVGVVTNLITSAWSVTLAWMLVALIVSWIAIESLGSPQENPTPSVESRLFVGVPAPQADLISRDSLATEIAGQIGRNDRKSVALTTALHGAGGFGKTTLAGQIAYAPQTSRHFTGGVVWVTLGQDLTRLQIANMINDLCTLLSEQHLPITDPFVAGARLGQLLDRRRPTLLIIDDVWRSTDVEPFMYGGHKCTRLLTTRLKDALPHGCAAVLVDEMEGEQSRRVITSGGIAISEVSITQLLELTGRWPLLLALVNGSLRQIAQTGGNVQRAADQLVDQLTMSGPAALDLGDALLRGKAVRSTLQSSFKLLSAAEYKAFRTLSIFPEDVRIPLSILRGLWRENQNSSGPDTDPAIEAVESWCGKFSRMSLVAEFRLGDSGFIRLHDVIRSYLRADLGARELAALNCDLLDRVTDALKGSYSTKNEVPIELWAALPVNQKYLWRNLFYHIRESGDIDLLGRIVEESDWVPRKLELLGVVSLEQDLSQVSDSKTATAVRRALSLNLHRLDPTQPNRSVVAILAQAIDRSEITSGLYDRLTGVRFRPALTVEIPISSRRSAELDRVFLAHPGPVTALAVSPDGRRFFSGGVDGTVLEWRRDDLSYRRVVGSHEGAITGLAVSDQCQWIASIGADGLIRMHNLITGSLQWTRKATRRAVTNLVLTPDGTSVITMGWHGRPTLWNAKTGNREATLVPTSKIIAFVIDFVLHQEQKRSVATALAVSPDGSHLAVAVNDRRVHIWDLRSRRSVAILPAIDNYVGTGIGLAIECLEWPVATKIVASNGTSIQEVNVKVPDKSGRASRIRWGMGELYKISRRVPLAWFDDFKMGLLRTSDSNYSVINSHMLTANVSRHTTTTSMAVAAQSREVVSGDSAGFLNLWNPTVWKLETKLIHGKFALPRRQDRVTDDPMGTIGIHAFTPRRGSALDFSILGDNVVGHFGKRSFGRFRGIAESDPGGAWIAVTVEAFGYLSALAWLSRDFQRIVSTRWTERRSFELLAPSRSGTAIATAGSGRSIEIRECPVNGSSLRRWDPNIVLTWGKSRNTGLAFFGPNDDYLVVGDNDGSLLYWKHPLLRVRNGRWMSLNRGLKYGLYRVPPSVRIAAHSGRVTALRSDPSGNYLASGGDDGELSMRSFPDPFESVVWRGSHEGPIADLAWGPDGRLIATLSAQSIAVWDSSTGECLAVMRGDDAYRAVVWQTECSLAVVDGSGLIVLSHNFP